MGIITLLKVKWNNFMQSPSLLLWFYIFLNMVPTLLLMYTEPLNIPGKITLLLFPLGLYMMIYTIFRNTGLLQLILFPLFFLHAFQIVLFYLFGEGVIAVDMFLNLVTSNVSEASELLNGIWPAILLVCLLYVPATCIAFKQWRRKIYLTKNRIRVFWLGLFIFVSSFIVSIFAIDKNTETYTLHENVYPVNIFYNLNFSVYKWKRNMIYFETSKDFTFAAHRKSPNKQREIYVMVIGETSRAENWGLYGYKRPTTPKLSQKENLVHFSDAITQSNTTHKSVSIMLSAANAENYNIIYSQKGILDAFKEVGIKTVFLSNQSENNTFTEYFSKVADYYHNFRSLDYAGLADNHFDHEMLPQMQEYIDSIDGDLLIILHTYGSHFKYSERYTKEFGVYKPDMITNISRVARPELINAYDNSILYTDHLLSSMIEMLETSGANATLMFSSDHGEDILDDKRDRFLHASPSPTYYQLKIPMLIWFSNEYSHTYPDKVQSAIDNQNKPVATNSIFHTLLNLASIETQYLEEDLSLISSTFKARPRMYLNDHDLPVPYYKMNLKEEDFEMIEKRNMHM